MSITIGTQIVDMAKNEIPVDVFEAASVFDAKPTLVVVDGLTVPTKELTDADLRFLTPL